MASKSPKPSISTAACGGGTTTTTMDVEKVFHMNGGTGQTSYSKNSSLQKKASDKVKHVTLESIERVFVTTVPRSMGIADLGCSSGPNTLSSVKDMVERVGRTSRTLGLPEPEFRVYLNDLPTNDFNSIFQALPEFQAELKRERGGGGEGGGGEGGPWIYIAGCPGTFYGRLFPENWLHFIYSSNSLHWLSKVPPGLYDAEGRSKNKGSVYITEGSPPEVAQAYAHQFNLDFSLFLGLRSKELIMGGKMVLIFLGRETSIHIDRGNSFLWDLLTKAFSTLISKGEVEEEKVDAYDVHFYAPSMEEVEEAVESEGSFEMEMLQMFGADNKGGEDSYKNDDGEMMMMMRSYGRRVAMGVRAVQESMLTHHFGGGILDSLFEEYGRLLDLELGIQHITPITFVLVLRKL
ncbi:unnamed protein product [Cuscuta campestris]|uniref:Jasmonate O-methyltransferase n=2 Tax=Cuscuta sect. Cleistogrammica TaxID=1824901 RepID=A0A484NHC9_9ASTE|nr:hypothetical protein DM860_004834 [Cuscuta australis]VFQ99897.1 unnamed protein product [Cuscuta campestris]